MPEEFVNQLHCGDNLERLQGAGVDKAIPDEVADLIYLDPPFNSARNYNLLFKQHKGQDSPAQIMTFEDTWVYSPFLMQQFKGDPRNSELFGLIASLFQILGESEMMAYLLMMAPRLLELHRKLKKTGSLYLHCDPVASHYLKIILDVIFGPQNFGNEVIWKRSLAKGDAVRHYGRNHDVLLWYHRSSDYSFKPTYVAKDEAYHGRFDHDDNDGKGPYHLAPLDSPNPRPNLMYEYKGYPHPPKGWRVSQPVMEQLDAEGRVWFPKDAGGRLRRKLYASDQQGAKGGTCGRTLTPCKDRRKNAVVIQPKNLSPF